MTSQRIAAPTPVEGFVDFYQAEHAGQVRRAYLILGDGGIAHDVVATAFLAVYQRWDHIDRHGPYLNRCVLNGCRDAARRRGREQPSSQPLEDDGQPDEIDELGDLLAQLSFRQRSAVVLRFYGGCSEAEIAESLGCRPGTVGSLIHRGLRTLRELLTMVEDDDG